MINSALIDMLLKSMGYNPEDFKEQLTTTFNAVRSFDDRLKAIESQLAILVSFTQLQPLQQKALSPTVHNAGHS